MWLSRLEVAVSVEVVGPVPTIVLIHVADDLLALAFRDELHSCVTVGAGSALAWTNTTKYGSGAES